MRYRVAISIWGNRVSPVMDTAGRLLVIDYNGNREIDHSVIELPLNNLNDRIDIIRNHKINLLICGAISTQMHQMLKSSGIEIVPFICGTIHKILAAYENDILQNGDFDLPGCRKRNAHTKRIRCRRQGRR